MTILPKIINIAFEKENGGDGSAGSLIVNEYTQLKKNYRKAKFFNTVEIQELLGQGVLDQVLQEINPPLKIPDDLRTNLLSILQEDKDIHEKFDKDHTESRISLETLLERNIKNRQEIQKNLLENLDIINDKVKVAISKESRRYDGLKKALEKAIKNGTYDKILEDLETKIQQGNISINDHKNITSFIADKLGLDTFQNMKPVDQELRKDSSGANLEVQARNAIKLNLENRRNSMSFSNRIQIDKQGHPIEKVHANKTEQADNTSKRRRFSSMKEVFKKFQDKVKSRKNTNSGRTI